jgi:hypothetical protein
MAILSAREKLKTASLPLDPEQPDWAIRGGLAKNIDNLVSIFFAKSTIM